MPRWDPAAAARAATGPRREPPAGAARRRARGPARPAAVRRRPDRARAAPADVCERIGQRQHQRYIAARPERHDERLASMSGTTYRLIATDNDKLQSNTGKRVEVKGTLESSSASSSYGAGAGSTAGTSGSTSARRPGQHVGHERRHQRHGQHSRARAPRAPARGDDWFDDRQQRRHDRFGTRSTYGSGSAMGRAARTPGHPRAVCQAGLGLCGATSNP